MGKELTSVDPNKEMQYAELEHFQEKSVHNKPSNRENNLNHTVDDEPVSLPLSSRACMSFLRKPTYVHSQLTFPSHLMFNQQANLRRH